MKQFIADLKDGDSVTSTFMVGQAALAVGKTGKAYMQVTLLDRTGEVDCRIWDNAEDYAGQLGANTIVTVEGRCQLFQGRKQIIIHRLRVADATEVDLSDLTSEPALDPDLLYEDLLGIIDSMRDPHYKGLAEAFFVDDAEIARLTKIAPAAKSLHHAYKTGLLEHMISIAKTLDFLASHYSPYLDRDLLLLGGFFHDIGKLWELSYEDGPTDYTTEGRLIGHLVMGVEWVNKKIALLEAEAGRLPEPFPEEKRLLVKHMILAHHGQLEYGSPKRPKCLEALIVHAIDDLDSKVNAIRVFTERDPSLDNWTYLSRQFNRFFYKPQWAKQDPT